MYVCKCAYDACVFSPDLVIASFVTYNVFVYIYVCAFLFICVNM